MERQILSVGVADLVNFSRAAAALGSEGSVDLVQEAYQAAGDVILRCDGRIHKYLGDAILFSCADPRKAIQAAQAIATSYRREVDGLTVRYRVAVATGEVLVGKVGHPSYLVEDIMGTTVNQAFILLRTASQADAKIALCEETRKYA